MPEMQHQESQYSVTDNDADEDTDPLSSPAGRIAISLQHAGPCDHTPRRQVRLVHTLATGSARIGTFGEFVHHHALEDVGLIAKTLLLVNGNTEWEMSYRRGTHLIIDVMEYVFPKDIQNSRAHQEAAHAHPKAIRKSDDGQRDHKDREE